MKERKKERKERKGRKKGKKGKKGKKERKKGKKRKKEKKEKKERTDPSQLQQRLNPGAQNSEQSEHGPTSQKRGQQETVSHSRPQTGCEPQAP